MRKQYLMMTGLVGVLAVSACSDDKLNVKNPNNPDVATVLATGDAIESATSALYKQVHNAQYGSGDAIWPQAQTMAFESAASVANFGMSLRGGLPRLAIDNNRGNQTATGNLRDFSQMQRQARSGANIILALDKLKAGNGTIGTAARDARTKAFAYFIIGISQGNSALIYDSSAVISPAIIKGLADPSASMPLASYTDVMTNALSMLDSAFATATGMANLDDNWIITGSATTEARFKEIIRSYKARFRAGVARTPTERAAVNWAQVIADANAGLSSDLTLQINSSAGWSTSFQQQFMVYQGWHQMPMFFYGMADTSGAYDAWLNLANSGSGAKAAFLVQTPDARWPSGATRLAQQLKGNGTATTSQTLPVGTQYIRARAPGDDTPGDAWQNSYYDFNRFYVLRSGSGNGPYVVFSKTEVDMLAAEGYLRTNQNDLAIAKINISRTRNSLPAIPNGATTVPLVGARGCVPRVPAKVGGTFTTSCGTLFEAMKYEKRLETAFTGYAQWYIDARGWGDLAAGTALQWPVPYQEMDARLQSFYNSNTQAAASTYGFP